MRNAAPLTFGARLATHAFTKEEILRIFNVPEGQLNDNEPPAPAETDERVQIGPLDV